jgi:hypothetical protein
LPYCMDKRHPPDQLFLVCEADFRLHAADAEKIPASGWQSLLADAAARVVQAHANAASDAVFGSELRARPAAPLAGGPPEVAPTSDPTQSPEGAASRTDRPAFGAQRASLARSSSGSLGATAKLSARGQKRAVGGLPASLGGGGSGPSVSSAASPADAAAELYLSEGARTQRESFFGWHKRCPKVEPSTELRDIVRLVTAAARLGRGECVWLSWEPGGRKSHPGHGTTAVAITARFAARFAEILGRVIPDHLDLILVRWLQLEGDEVGACYVSPSLGSYCVHQSDCQPGLGIRPSSFGAKHNQDGLRGEKGFPWLAGFCSKGGPKWLTPRAVDLDDPRLEWRTQRPPTVWWSPLWEARLQRRQWVYQGEWWGPPWSTGRGGYTWWEPMGKKGGQARGGLRPSPVAPGSAPSSQPGGRSLDELRRDPDGYSRAATGSGQAPITRLAQQLVVDPDECDDCPLPPAATSRQGRHRREALRLYEQRHFVDGLEADGTKREGARGNKKRGSGRNPPGRKPPRPPRRLRPPAVRGRAAPLAGRSAPKLVHSCVKADAPWWQPQALRKEGADPVDPMARGFRQGYHRGLWNHLLGGADWLPLDVSSESESA